MTNECVLVLQTPTPHLTTPLPSPPPSPHFSEMLGARRPLSSALSLSNHTGPRGPQVGEQEVPVMCPSCKEPSRAHGTGPKLLCSAVIRGRWSEQSSVKNHVVPVTSTWGDSLWSARLSQISQEVQPSARRTKGLGMGPRCEAAGCLAECLGARPPIAPVLATVAAMTFHGVDTGHGGAGIGNSHGPTQAQDPCHRVP